MLLISVFALYFIGSPHKFLQVKGNLIALPFCSIIQFVIVLAGFPLSKETLDFNMKIILCCKIDRT